MKNYEIVNMDNEVYEIIIFSQSYNNPFYDLQKIQSDLIKINNSQYKVLFDMLLNMGNTSERFIEADFDGSELKNFKHINISKDNEIRSISKNYYKNKNLGTSALNPYQIKMIKSGIAI